MVVWNRWKSTFLNTAAWLCKMFRCDVKWYVSGNKEVERCKTMGMVCEHHIYCCQGTNKPSWSNSESICHLIVAVNGPKWISPTCKLWVKYSLKDSFIFILLIAQGHDSVLTTNWLSQVVEMSSWRINEEMCLSPGDWLEYYKHISENSHQW